MLTLCQQAAPKCLSQQRFWAWRHVIFSRRWGRVSHRKLV